MFGDKQRGGVVWRGALVLLVCSAVAVGWSGFRAWGSWHGVERVSFDTGKARTALDEHRITTTTVADELPPSTVPPPSPFDRTLAILVVGSDERTPADLSRRADVILMLVLPPDGGDPLLFSIPRDLWLANPCTGGMSRVNVNLTGCGTRASGPEQLAVAVEDFTGIGVDHFVVFNFAGFRTVVDRVGGVEICLDNPVRDRRARLELPAGCTMANGAQALAWVRSRHTLELVGGVWRVMPGVNDLTRNERQQDLVIEALKRLKSFRNIAELSGLVDDLAEAAIIDDNLSLADAVALAWEMRNLDVSRIIRFVIPTQGMLTVNGESVLRPIEPFETTLRAATPDADAILGT